ncbi:hypothetical protein ITI46_28655 [Streptomyces oryzae]|uniref:Regulatory protein n=1 Tax=Streptomyces oryzae TaxID=1434886 RepID=A0ABS3XKI1_9ACTN|nr:hypothetical protein [Streptomyces oryzae]MBO8195591.1 hypothetical protein [Streptomyces oryzae]
MAKPFVRVDVSASSYMVATLPVPKVRNQETGELYADQKTGEPLATVNLVETLDGRAQLIKVTIPESGAPEGLAPGAQVVPRGMIASPWANKFGDQVNTGLAYRAEGLEAAQ